MSKGAPAAAVAIDHTEDEGEVVEAVIMKEEAELEAMDMEVATEMSVAAGDFERERERKEVQTCFRDRRRRKRCKKEKCVRAFWSTSSNK